MTNDQLKKLQNDLWASANSLRAYGGMTAANYAVPVLGLIFLRFADNKYSQFEPDIIKELEEDKGTRRERSIESIAIDKCGFYLPDYARYDYLLKLPGEQKLAEALRAAMEGIEQYQDEKFKDVLPKEAYFDIEKKKADILPQLLKTFSDIPKDATGDIFGKIYEFFLGEFAMSEGQKGGEFFTPTSVVRFIVEVIEPFAGKIFDPACGSGGMFVQSAKFIKEANHDLSDIYVCGQENIGQTVRLAKMNLMVNNIRGEIAEVNSYKSDPFVSLSKFDFVMANPPFNVKSVKESDVINDERFYKYGLPKNKGKNTEDSITDANYLWVSLFATSLNDKGRAGFVMPNSASDAGNSEYDIRRKMVDSGMVDCMVSMPSNMFFTVTLPATLWFLDKQKMGTDRMDKILFLDARNTYHQINRAQREWKEEQIQNLAAIVRLYRGETDRYLELVSHYIGHAEEAIEKLPAAFDNLQTKLQNSLASLRQYAASSTTKRKPEEQAKLDPSGLLQKLNDFGMPESSLPNFTGQSTTLSLSEAEATTNDPSVGQVNISQLAFTETLTAHIALLKDLDAKIKTSKDAITEIWTEADKLLKLKADKNWSELELSNLAKNLDELHQNWKNATAQVTYWHSNIHWLQSRFPNATYRDVVGLCKVADKVEYAVEQDYSLNAGRYVGIEITDDDISPENFKNIISEKYSEFEKLSGNASSLEIQIKENLKSLFV
jgi:type I restriction enzyme M protein